MCLLRCSACFGPHSFAHSCPADPASTRPSSNKIILHNLRGARGLTRDMNAYVITSSSFVVFPVFQKVPDLTLIIFDRNVRGSCCTLSCGIGSCIHILINPSTEEAAPKIFIVWQAAFQISQYVEDWLLFQFATVKSQFDM